MEAVRSGLRNILNDLLRNCPRDEAVVLAWPLVCGKEVAARSQAVKFADGNLTVEVPDMVWRNQLQSFAPRYIAGYEELLGPLVQTVRFEIKQSATGHQRSAKTNNL